MMGIQRGTEKYSTRRSIRNGGLRSAMYQADTHATCVVTINLDCERTSIEKHDKCVAISDGGW